MGTEGARSVIVNSRGRELKEIGIDPPREGRRLQLTIDADLQKAAEEGFRHFGEVQSGKAFNGAAIVLDPRTGEVLTFAPNGAPLPRAAKRGHRVSGDPPRRNQLQKNQASCPTLAKKVIATRRPVCFKVPPEENSRHGGEAGGDEGPARVSKRQHPLKSKRLVTQMALKKVSQLRW